ncbi:MAG TPA: PilZ domain-containing protein [Allosphingosinicella sp.]|nr:PilZ domain-containing protein [Allosphingosinicella sp.]
MPVAPRCAILFEVLRVVETIFSLFNEIPGSDDPPGLARDGAFLQEGSLVLGTVREVCSIRKISGVGAILHADLPVASGERLELELMSGDHIDGVVEWRRGSDVGLRFDQPIDIFSLLARNLVSQPGERRRMPRVELLCPALLETPSRTELVTTRDVAQGGVKLDTPVPLAVDEKVMITLEGFRPLEGEVRWVEGGLAGIAFSRELGWQEMMPWLKQRRQAAFSQPARDAETSAPAFDPTPTVLQAGSPETAAADTVQLNLAARVREGTRRWKIEVSSITTRTVEFESFVPLRIGTSLWVVLPGLEGWPARIVDIDGYRFTCEFTQPLHPAVLERILTHSAS